MGCRFTLCRGQIRWVLTSAEARSEAFALGGRGAPSDLWWLHLGAVLRLQLLVVGHGVIETLHQRPPCRVAVTPAVQLGQCQRCGFKTRELPRRMGFANDVAARRHIVQRKAWQLLQGGVEVQHFAAFAPGAIQHDQAQLLRLRKPCPRQCGRREQRQLWIGRSGGVEQGGVHRGICCLTGPGSMQPLLQVSCRKNFSYFQAAACYALVQQARRVFGVPYFQRVLQHQQLHRTGYGVDAVAPAGLQGAQTGGAQRAWRQSGSCKS
jgi:hypothetical protein